MKFNANSLKGLSMTYSYFATATILTLTIIGNLNKYLLHIKVTCALCYSLLGV